MVRPRSSKKVNRDWNLARAVRSGLVAQTLLLHVRGVEPIGSHKDVSPAAFGAWLGISDDGAGADYLGKGWYPAEAWGVWGQGEAHELRLCLAELPSNDIELDAEVEVLLIGTREAQQIDVVIAGERLTTWDFTIAQNRGLRTVRIPKEAARVEEGFAVILVEFRPRSVAVPQELDPILTDTRSLGLGLRGFRQRVATDEPAQLVPSISDERNSQTGDDGTALFATGEPALVVHDRPSSTSDERKAGDDGTTLLQTGASSQAHSVGAEEADSLNGGGVAQIAISPQEIGAVSSLPEGADAHAALPSRDQTSGSSRDMQRRSPFLRRILRIAAHGVRPLFLPILRVLDRRIRSAVETTTLAAKSEAIEQGLQSVQELLRGMAARQIADQRKLDGLDELLPVIAARQIADQRKLDRLNELLSVMAARQLADQRKIDHLLSDLAALQTVPNALSELRLNLVSSLDSHFAAIGARHGAALAKFDRLLLHLLVVREKLEDTAASQGGIQNALTSLAAMQEKQQQNFDRNIDLLHNKLDSLYTLESGYRASLDHLLARHVIPLGDGVLAIRSPYGYLLVPAEDAALAAHLADGVLPEPGTRKVIETILKPGMTFLDVGANVGLFTLLGARHVGPSGSVIALEPTPRLASLLRKSIIINGFPTIVEFHEVAAGDSKTPNKLNIAFTSGHNSLFALPGAHSSLEVVVTTIDDLLGSSRSIDVVKIDVEGAELNVLRGMKHTLAKNKEAVIIVEYSPYHLQRVGITVSDWFAALRGMGFEIWEIDDEIGSVRRLRKRGLKDISSINLLLTRGNDDRLRSLIQDSAS